MQDSWINILGISHDYIMALEMLAIQTLFSFIKWLHYMDPDMEMQLSC